MTDPHAAFLPSCFVLGAAKCGTTSLHDYLSEFPQVCMSDPKEPFFFECEFERGIDFFREQYFPHWDGEPIQGESRHRNLYLPWVASRIYEFNPNAKLIVLMREPVDRAISHWNHWYSRGHETLPFHDAIAADLERIESQNPGWSETTIRQHCATMRTDGKHRHCPGVDRTYVDSGYYAEQIERFLQFFPMEQIGCFFFEELFKDNPQERVRLLSFLGIEYDGDEPPDFPKSNLATRRSSGGRAQVYGSLRSMAAKLKLHRYTPNAVWTTTKALLTGKPHKRHQVRNATRELLAEHFRPRNDALRELLTRELPANWQRH